MSSFVGGETCGYVRAPLAATNDTVVIKVDCSHPTPFPADITSHLGDNVTHLAVRLIHCHTVPVGLFTSVTDILTSVTVASEDAAELLERTFEGLGHVTELRLLGFSSLLNVSRSLFEPLKNIDTLILDRFGRSNVKLSHIGSVIQRLSGTPLKRLVLNDIRNRTKSRYFEDITMQMNDFTLTNASVRKLIISNTPIQYEGSIRRALPHLVCFHGSIRGSQTKKSLPVMWDLTLLSNTLKEFVLRRSNYISPVGRLLNVAADEVRENVFDAIKLYPELWFYFLNRPRAKNCTYELKLKFGTNVSRITVNRVAIFVRTIPKPICFEENNQLEYFDLTRTPLQTTSPASEV